MQNQEEFLIAARKYFSEDYRGKIYWQRFYAADLIDVVATEMAKSSLPTVTAAHLTFEKLVREGIISRTDGKTEHDDRKEAVDKARKNLDETIVRVSAPPLRPSELEYFGSLSQFELAKLYWGPDNDGLTDFAARYNKAAKEFGFVIPGRLERAQEVAEQDDPGALKLSATEYHALPANVVCQRLREPRFRAAVDKLIREAKI